MHSDWGVVGQLRRAQEAAYTYAYWLFGSTVAISHRLRVILYSLVNISYNFTNALNSSRDL